jgi:translation initiation factor IF-2
LESRSPEFGSPKVSFSPSLLSLPPSPFFFPCSRAPRTALGRCAPCALGSRAPHRVAPRPARSCPPAAVPAPPRRAAPSPARARPRRAPPLPAPFPGEPRPSASFPGEPRPSASFPGKPSPAPRLRPPCPRPTPAARPLPMRPRLAEPGLSRAPAPRPCPGGCTLVACPISRAQPRAPPSGAPLPRRLVSRVSHGSCAFGTHNVLSRVRP